MKLSIIIPVFNVEKYLNKCLDSVFNQDIPYSDYEVILVNDGSTDNSEEIILKYKKQFPNLKYYKQKNSGPSKARNKGLDHATGEYIWFVDADDWIASNSLNRLLKYISKHKLDFCQITSCDIINNNTHTKLLNRILFEKVVDALSLIKDYKIPTAACDHLIKREILTTNNIRFVEKMLHEDFEFNIRTISYCHRISTYTSNEALYFYQMNRLGSTMTNPAPEHYLKRIDGYVHILNMINEQFPYKPSVKDYAYYVHRLSNYIITEHLVPLIQQSSIADKNKLFKKTMRDNNITYNYEVLEGAAKYKFRLLSLFRTNYRVTNFLLQSFDKFVKVKRSI